MFSYLYLDNYKSLSDVYIDLHEKGGGYKKLVVIYGENGSGKSNIIDSFNYLSRSIQSLFEYEIKIEAFNSYMSERKNIEKDEGELFKAILGMGENPISNYNDHYMVDCFDEDMILEYGFYYKGVEGYYRLIFDRQGLKEESMYHIISKNRGEFFSINRDGEDFFSQNIFLDKDYLNELKRKKKMYWGKHTLLSIIFKELREYNLKEYMLKNINYNLIDIINNLWQNSMVETDLDRYPNSLLKDRKIYKDIFEDPISGKLEFNDKIDFTKLFKKAEQIIKKYLSTLYSDIIEVEYKFEFQGKEVKYELYIYKNINGRIRKILASQESAGTKRVLILLGILLEATRTDKVSIIDEADNGIHDLLFTNIIMGIKEDAIGQVIITTHNTTLLEVLDIENIYIIDIDSEGNKEVLSLEDYDIRTQKNNNIRKRYLEGAYGGVPHGLYLDFKELGDSYEDFYSFKKVDDKEGI